MGTRTKPQLVGWSEYSRTDRMTSDNWDNIFATDFQDITSLEKRGDLRAVLVAMAKFFKLKVNESALDLETLPQQ